ncbi:acyl-CoA dehydrogenase family protein [Nocardia asteroides]|uniref:acyl-CoA dehydrogenase family protein n=1 Tax=Nocardia asteroides TaxID=1824 RepID=UPI001E2E8D70|nr:acyl-CoA dehydrogenase family protein [Nocardia asteroides]UGT54238.1 acyl-CoA dehydrogenase family protein [Nocardia asteroides]
MGASDAASAAPSWAADPESLALRDTARKFFATSAVPHRARWAEQGFVDREFWREAGALGLLCLEIPAEYGGGGGTFAHEMIVLEEQGRIDEPGFGNHVHSGIVAPYLLAYGTERQKRDWLPRMATGEVVAAIAMTEPGGGSDLANMSTRAVAENGDYLISGAKTFITNGGSADLILVAAKTDPDGGAHGVSLFLVDAATPGFRRGRVLDKLGQRSGDTAELFFDEVRVPASNLLGEVAGQGFFQLMTQLPQERLLLAVGAVVSAESAVDRREYPIAEMFVNARAQRIYGGANEIMKELIARSL